MVLVLVALAASAAAVAPALAGGGGHPGHTDGPTAQPGSVTIARNAYNPQRLTVEVGERISWRNDDFIEHTVTSADGTLDSPRLGEGDGYAHTFTAPGSIAYVCTIHPFMRGTVTVAGMHPPIVPAPLAGTGQRVLVDLARGSLHVRTMPPRPGARIVVQRWWRERFAWRVIARVRLDDDGRAVVRLRPIHRARGRVQAVLAPADGVERSVGRIRIG